MDEFDASQQGGLNDLLDPEQWAAKIVPELAPEPDQAINAPIIHKPRHYSQVA